MLLSTEQMSNIPASVSVLANWGDVSIFVDNDVRRQFVGTHVALEGPEDDIKKWILAYDAFWVGVGSPMLQNFTLYSKE
jgi:hypothetical protein